MGQDALLNLGAFALQVSVIVVAAALLLRMLRIASPGARYVCWRVVLVVCVAMPLLLQRPAAPATADEGVTLSGHLTTVGTVADADPMAARVPPAPQPMPWGDIAALVIALGAAARGGWLAMGVLRLRTLRRRGMPVEDIEYADIQRTLGTRASLSSVPGLTQPATFGLWRPVVLLPDTLGDSPAALRRAVVTHELFHVQRRDWLWVLAEEMLRSVLWFHPAIAWLTSRIQLAREELVDELTVLATGNRKAYIEALLAFADGGRMRPAPAFARRRHLFTRILRLSKESVMSSPRIVASTACVIAAVLGIGWYASVAFPILAAAPTVAPANTLPAASTNAQPWVSLPRYQVDRLFTSLAGRSGPATSAVPQQSLGAPAGVPALISTRSGRRTATAPQKVPDALRRNEDPAAQGARSGGAPRPGPAPVAAPTGEQTKPITPENPIPRRVYSVPVPYPAELRGSQFRAIIMVRARVDAAGSVADVRRIMAQASVPSASVSREDRDRASEAFAAAAVDAIRQWRYQAPAEAPIAFFVAVTFDPDRDGAVRQSDVPILPPPGASITFTTQGSPAISVGALLTSPSGRAPVRVGGNIAPPQKVKDVRPAYPEVAKAARVQGVVILEALIDEQGRVPEARVLRSIPSLDQAALDAVRQWEFTPTLLNGAPTPIIMTVTVQFVLPDAAATQP